MKYKLLATNEKTGLMKDIGAMKYGGNLEGETATYLQVDAKDVKIDPHFSCLQIFETQRLKYLAKHGSQSIRFIC